MKAEIPTSRWLYWTDFVGKNIEFKPVWPCLQVGVWMAFSGFLIVYAQILMVFTEEFWGFLCARTIMGYV